MARPAFSAAQMAEAEMSEASAKARIVVLITSDVPSGRTMRKFLDLAARMAVLLVAEWLEPTQMACAFPKAAREFSAVIGD